MGPKTIVFVVAIVASAVAGPLEYRSGPCARQCTESSKFKYTPGTSYFFDYESDAITLMQGATQEESRLHLKAKVEIHAISKCDFIMRLTGTSLEHSDPRNPRSRRPVHDQESFRQALERNTLRFSFQDGQVETICPVEGETAQVLNIKRGILSVLQTSADSLETTQKVLETDVAGKCKVIYEPLGRGWNSVTVRKSKDLTSCSERHNYETAIQVNPFDEETKSMSLVRGNQECQQVFKHDRLESVICSETHVFRPFARQEGGAATKISQALTFNSEKKTAFTGADYSSLRKAMTFDHEPDTAEKDRRARQVELTFVDLCMAAKDDIRPSVPGKFTTFVYNLRKLEHTDIVNLFRRVDRICPDNSKAKKLYIDGVSMAGTSGSIKFIVDMMQRGEMPEKDVDLWISSLAFVNKPTKEAIVSLLPLLDGRRPEALLPVSAVVHTYCLQNAECGLQNEVRQAVSKITAVLGNKCTAEKSKVMLALKALGNIGVASEAEEKLQSCAQNKDLDTEIRIAAIQAYRRFGCDTMRSPIVELYTDLEENVEIRIAAFLNIMRCPSSGVFMKIKDTMEAEKIKQVGSFVLSYLKNIEKQTSHKNDVQEIINNLDYLNKFESDIRKFSRNIQNSIFIDSLDSGISLDSNIIFDPSSYLPRTAMLNLTVDMMGTKINMFELEGRAEGLERMVESMFGPDGYFRGEKDSHRPKKSVNDNKIEKIDRKYDVKKNFDKDPSLSLDMKIFGNSLLYKKLQQGNLVSEAFGAMDIMVALAKEQEMEFTKSFMFLDTTVHIPTGSGFPLKLAINGSAVINMKMSGKVDAKNVQNIDVHGKIQPSGAIEIATLMSVDAGVAKTGLKMVATLHSSTLLDGLVEVRNGKLFQARLNMPRDQIEIIDVQSRIFLANGEEEREQNSNVEQSTLYTQCTGEYTKKPLGVEACGELQIPSVGRKDAPLYPFSGPARLRLFIRKTDPSLTSYNAEIKWTEDKNGREVTGHHMVMSFNTPESKIDREVSMEYHLNKIDNTLAMKLKVPNHKLALTGKRVMNENEKRLSVAVSVDDVEKFSFATALLSEAIEGGIRYQPTLEVRGLGNRLMNIRSSASIKNRKYSGDLAIEDLTERPIQMNGEVTMGERDRYDVNAMVESYPLSAKVKGHAQFRSGFSSKMNVQYRIMDGRKENLDITSKIRDLSASGLTKYTGAASLVSSAIPEITTSVSWDTQITSGHVENSFELSFGDGRIRKIQKVSVHEILRYEGELENNKVEGTFRVTYPEKDIDFGLQLNHKNTLETLLNTINLKYAPGKEASSSVDLKMNPRPLQLTGDIQVKYPGREMRLQSNVNQNKDREYEATMTAQWQRGKQVRTVGNFRDQSNRDGKDYQATIEMTIPNARPISLSSRLTTLSGQYVFTADGEFGRGGYGVKGEYARTSAWNHRASALVKTPRNAYTGEISFQKAKDLMNGKIDINVPEYRRVTGSVDVSNGPKVKTAALDIMWDADRDQSERLQLDTEFRLNAEGHQGKFSYKCPCTKTKTLSGSYNANYAGQYQSGIMRGNWQAELVWDKNQKVTVELGGNLALKQSRRQINGELKVTTPIRDYDNLVLTVQHTDTWPEWNNKLTAQWSKGRKVTFGTEGKIRTDPHSTYLDASMRLNTPFRGYESLSLRQVFEKRSAEVTSSSYLQWAAGKTMELSMSGAVIASGVRAGMNFTSPFNTLRDASMTFSHGNTKNAIDTNVDLRWNTRNTLSINFDGRNMMTGKKHTCSAELQFQSTLRGYERMSTKLVYNNDGSAASLNSDVRWGNNKVTFGLNGANKNSYYGYDMEGKLQYTSNFRNFESGEIKVAHTSDAQKFSSNIESKLPYNHNLNLKLRGNMPSVHEMDSSLILDSSFIDGVTYEVAYNVAGNRLTANGLATYGLKKVSGDILGTAEYGRKTWDLDYKVNINTPIRGYEDMKFALTHAKRDLQFTTRAQGSINQKVISLNHDLKIEDKLNFVNNMRLTTPYRDLPSMEIETRQNGKNGGYKHVTEVSWSNKKAGVSMEFNNRSQRRQTSIDARLNAKTPFETLSDLDIEFKHEDDESTFKPSFSMQWNGDNKVSIDGNLNHNNRFQNVGASLTATSSFPGYKNMVLTGKFDVSGRQKTAEVTSNWGDRSNKAASIMGVVEYSSRTGMIEITTTTPVRGLERMQLKADYALAENEHTLNAFTLIGSKRYSFNGKHVGNSNGHEVNAQVSTPVYGYERVTAFGTYAINRDEMTSEVSYEWGNSKKVAVNADYKARNGELVTKLRIATPFQGYQKMAMKIEGNTQSPKKTGSIMVSWDPEQVLQADITFESDYKRFGNINLALRSPFDGFKDISMNGQAKVVSKQYLAEGTVQWLPNKKITAKVEVQPRQIEAALDTPYRPFKNVRFSANLNKRDEEIHAKANLEWENTKKADVTATARISDNMLEGKVEVNVPLNGKKTYSATGSLKNDNYNTMEGQIEVIIPDKRYSATGSLKNDHYKMMEGQIDVIIPDKHYSATGSFKNDHYKMMEGRLEVNIPGERYSATGSFKNDNYKMMEGRVEVNIPNELYSATGSFKNDNYNMMEGRAEVSIRDERYQVSSLLRMNRDSKDISVAFEGPKAKIAVNGNLVKKLQEFEATLKTESNVKSVPSFSMKGSFKNRDWKNIEASADLNNAHTFSGSFKNEDKTYIFDASAESPMLYGRRVMVSTHVNAKDIRNMDGKFALETSSDRHIFTISEKMTRRGFESEMKANSPLIHGNEVTVNLFFSNSENKDIQGKLSVFENRIPHIFEFAFNRGTRDITGKINIECRYIPTGKMTVETRLTRPTENTMELTLIGLTGTTRHSFVANSKMVKGQYELVVKVDSPTLPSRTMSLTVSLNNDYYKAIDGTISLMSGTSESRVAFNMKRNGWTDVVSFFTLNLPIDTLSMLRVDMKMKNDKLDGIEGSLDLQSSLPQIRKVSMSGKMKNTESAWDMSMNFKLPVRNWDNISLLATLHKNQDLSRVTPRITLSLPNKKYVAYANYEKNSNDVLAVIGSEWERNKVELSAHKRDNEYRITLVTPIQGHERYSAVATYKNEKNKRSAIITFEDARNGKYTADVNLSFHNIVNFNGEANLRMPVSGLRDVSTKLRQTFRRGRWSMSFEHNMERQNKVALSIEHDTNNPITGTIQLTTPMESMKTLKLNYNWQESNTNGKMDVEVNNRNILRMSMEKAYQADARDYSNTLLLEFPTFPSTFTISNKPLPSGMELALSSTIPSRTMNFKTMYQSSSNHFSHGTQLTWDESTGKTLSYEIRNSPTSRQGRELYARLNMPIRSFELRTTHEKSSTGRTVSGDFLWDASRDQSKHMKMTLEHVDNSNRYNTAHKLRLIAAHPQFSKDIVLATECLLTPNEIYGKTEVEYSRFQQHNIFLEARARNNAKGRHESRYIATLAARHPVTNLNMKMEAELANNQQEMSAQMKFDYLDRNLKQQIQELRTKIQKMKQNMELMARSNENKINVEGKMFQRDNELTLSLQQTINNESPIQSYFRLSQQHKNMELNISGFDGDRIHLRASLPDDHLEAEISHTISGRQYKDGKFYLGLKESKILESRINWRPEMVSEARETLNHAYNRQLPKLMSSFKVVRDEISNEIDSKSDLLTNALSQEIKPFVSDMTREMRKMKVDQDRAANELSHMYRKNDFFVRSAAESMEDVIHAIGQSMQDASRYIAEKFEILKEAASMSYESIVNFFDGLVEYVYRAAAQYQKAISRAMDKLSKKFAQLRREYMETITELAVEGMHRLGKATQATARWVKNTVARYAPTVERYLKVSLKEVESLLAWIKEQYGDQLNSVYDSPAYKALNEYYARVIKTVDEFKNKVTYDQIVRGTRMLMNNGVENVVTAYEYIRDHPNINYVNDVASQAFNQGRQFALELGMNTMTVNILEELYQKVQYLAWNSLRDLVDEYATFRGNMHYVFDPENGKIEMEMRLPVVRNSLKQLLDVNSYPQVQKLKELSSQISFGDFCIWDTYYKYKRYTDISYWLPPFRSQAMIVGSQHFMTFDNFDFDFAGECSYLLARDFLDGNFTVTVNYARDNKHVVKKSLNVHTDGVKIEVSRDNKVTIDDRKVELPQEVGKTSVTMEDGVITVSNKLGYKIKCNFVHDLCTLDVSGFYFGKTGGLFGTNNYEPALDMMTPDNTVARNLEEFSDSWQVGSAQCTTGRNLAEVAPVDKKAKDKCERLFKAYSSEFRSGFRQVDPEPFLRMCINDLSIARESEHKFKICSTAAAYVERCRQQGVNLNMPKHCVRCQRLSGDDMESGDVVKITKDEPVRAADIVFIVEEKGCNKNMPTLLSKMAQSFDDGFRKKGYRQVHFAVVGFGGDGIYSEPHVVTADSQVFGTVRNIDSALNSLPTGNGDSNIFMALRYAAGLPFMTGSTKTFILAKCSSCEVEEMKADYSEMLRTMLDSDITMHLLMDHEYESKSSARGSKLKKVLGFDRKVAYTTKDIKDMELRGDRDILAQLKTPKDLCVPLALEVNGSFFSVPRLMENRNVNKKTMEVMSRRVMKSAEPADCQICECIATQSGIGKSVCQRCVSPVVAQLVSDDLSPIYYGYDSDNSNNIVESDEM